MLAEKQGLVRGFQGEIIFFRDEKMQTPIMVDGELTVYLYDADDHTITDCGNGVQGIKPLCEYKFNSEALAKGMAKNKKSKMISYGVWLPVDKMPGDEKHLVLWGKFEGSGNNGERLGVEPQDQITVYLPGNPVERKKQGSQPALENRDNIRQAACNDINDFSNIQQVSFTESVRTMQNGNKQVDIRRDNDAIPMPPGLARQIFSARQEQRQNNFQSETTTPLTGTASSIMPPQGTSSQRSVSVALGGGETPEPVNNGGYGNTTLLRNRQNITSIGAQIERRMQTQNGFAFADMGQRATNVPVAGWGDGGIQQASFVSQNQPSHSGQWQEMARFIAEEEQRRRMQNPPVNPQGFTEYNANSFATGQNRITVPESSWGVPPQRDYQQPPFQGQPQGHFAPNRFQAQNPGTSQFASYESDWGPGLESMPSSRETQVLYSPTAEDRIYR